MEDMQDMSRIGIQFEEMVLELRFNAAVLRQSVPDALPDKFQLRII